MYSDGLCSFVCRRPLLGGRFVTKNSNVTLEWNKRVWVRLFWNVLSPHCIDDLTMTMLTKLGQSNYHQHDKLLVNTPICPFSSRDKHDGRYVSTFINCRPTSTHCVCWTCTHHILLLYTCSFFSCSVLTWDRSADKNCTSGHGTSNCLEMVRVVSEYRKTISFT